jgi:ribosomal protein S18 acetylase RimI-like enzyme
VVDAVCVTPTATAPTVRQAHRGDLAALAGLCRQEVEHQQSFSGAFTVRQDFDWRRYVASRMRRAGRAVFVAESSGAVVGFVDVGVVDSPRAGFIQTARAWATRFGRLRADAATPLLRPRPRGYVYDIYVEAKVRHRGVATALLERGVGWLRNQGAREVGAAVWATNEASLAFFRRNGFEQSRIEVRLSDDP